MEIKIDKFDHLGQGIGKLNNKTVFVKYSLPEEILDINIIKDNKNYSFGKIVNKTKTNKNRVKPICPYYYKCGGCDLLHCNNTLEKEFKIEKCNNLLGINPIFNETKNLNYRNKITLHVRNNKLGLYQESSHKLVEIDNCYLVSDKINILIKELKDYLKHNKVNIKEIIIKTNDIDTLLYIDGKVDNNIINLNTNNIIVNDKVLKGNNYLIKEINGYKFKITAKSFFQVNYLGLESIYNILNKNLKDKYNTILDLYSGISTWGILLNKKANNIICVESNSYATRDAKEIIKDNGINNIKVINDKVENVIDTLINNVDLVIIDPPRTGLDNKTIDYLNKINSEELIYVSCDMLSLKRDLDKLNYKIKSIELVDMFPRTYHVETICVLERK